MFVINVSFVREEQKRPDPGPAYAASSEGVALAVQRLLENPKVEVVRVERVPDE